MLKQLVAVIGIDAFRAGMRRYFRAYEWRNATLQDFLGALEHGAGRAWASGPGSGWRRPA